MDPLTVVAVVCGLVLGLGVGAVAAALVLRSRADARAADAQAGVAQAQGEAAQARTEAAQARAETAQARSDTANARAETALARAELARDGTGVAEARALAADARAEAAAAQAEAADLAARVAAALAERDAARDRADKAAADREVLVNQFKVLSGETLERQGRVADAQAEARLKATELLMAPVKESLDRFNARLTEVEKDRVEMTASLRAQVQAVQATGETLRRETAALVTALRKPQVRGSWGETQLKRVAEISGMLERCDFDLQHTMTADDRLMRPDMRVHLAEGKQVFVDSKVPLTSFLDAHETDDVEERRRRLAHYARHVRTHIDQLSSKEYWKAAGSPEFVVLFLPSEVFLTEALDQLPDLYDYAARRSIVLATPATLIGLLRAVAFGWRQTALAESAAEVFRLGRELHERLATLGSRVDKLGRALRSSVNAYNETVGTLEGRVLVPARRLRDLKVSDLELDQLTGLDDAVRQLQAPELVEDAAQVTPLIGRDQRARPVEARPAPSVGADRPTDGEESVRAGIVREARTDTVPEADQLVRRIPELDDLVLPELFEGPQASADERASG